MYLTEVCLLAGCLAWITRNGEFTAHFCCINRLSGFAISDMLHFPFDFGLVYPPAWKGSYHPFPQYFKELFSTQIFLLLKVFLTVTKAVRGLPHNPISRKAVLCYKANPPSLASAS